MDFNTACERYQEEGGQGVMGLDPNPPLNSTHNGLLFSAVKVALMYQTRSLEIPAYSWLYEQARRRMIEIGLYSRLVGTQDIVAHDDLIGLATVDRFLASAILKYGEAHSWTWGDRKLWRMPIFIPAVKLGACRRLSILNHVMLAGCYLTNLLEKKSEVSGKQLLWLVSTRTNAWYARLWRNVTKWRYGGWDKMFAEYYRDPNHPFIEKAKEL